MNSFKTFLSIILLISLSFAQSARDMESESPASDNWQENYRLLERGESRVNIYSNAAVADVFVWNSTWLSTERTFPAVISLPTDNQVYTISLYPQSQFQYLTNELQNFDFDARDIAEFELLQEEFERMKMGTKNVRPIPATSESVFLTYFSFLLFFRKTTPFEKKEEKTLRRNPRGETPSRPRKRGKRTFAMASDNPKTRFPSKKKFWSSFSSLASALLLFFFFDDVFFTKSFKPDAKALPLLVAT